MGRVKATGVQSCDLLSQSLKMPDNKQRADALPSTNGLQPLSNLGKIRSVDLIRELDARRNRNLKATVKPSPSSDEWRKWGNDLINELMAIANKPEFKHSVSTLGRRREVAKREHQASEIALNRQATPTRDQALISISHIQPKVNKDHDFLAANYIEIAHKTLRNGLSAKDEHLNKVKNNSFSELEEVTEEGNGTIRKMITGLQAIAMTIPTHCAEGTIAQSEEFISLKHKVGNLIGTRIGGAEGEKFSQWCNPSLYKLRKTKKENFTNQEYADLAACYRQLQEVEVALLALQEKTSIVTIPSHEVEKKGLSTHAKPSKTRQESLIKKTSQSMGLFKKMRELIKKRG